MTELAKWNQRYSDPDYIFGTEPNAFVKREAERLKPGQRVLSVADGEGRNGVYLAGLGLDVLSVDFSPVAQAKAKALAAKRGVTPGFELASILDWHWPENHYDAIVGIFFQFTTPAERTRLFADIKRSVRPGGLVLLEGYRPEQLQYATGGPSEVEQLYTRALLEGAFGDWQILLLEEYDREIAEGPRHIGMSALIDLVARKPR